ncbi:hypothetical protein F2P79_011601 [Pimephales promelas]|nr:hypothetical protein F2P79_011601 [Pimephales promelas]
MKMLLERHSIVHLFLRIDSFTSCRSAHCSASQGWSLSDGGLSCQVRAKARMWRRQSEVYVQIKPSISSSALPVYQTLQRRQERKTAREHFITEERSVVRAKIIDPRKDGSSQRRGGWSDEVLSVERSFRMGTVNTEHSGVIATLHAP